MITRFFNHFKTYHVYYCFNFGILIGSIIIGYIFFKTQTNQQMIDLSESFLQVLSGTYIKESSYVTSHLLNSLFCLLIIYILGLSVIAFPFLAILLFYKGMQIGFTAGIYFYIFNLKGIWGILLTLLPYLLFEFVAYFISFAISYEISLSLFLTTFITKQVLSIKEVLLHLVNNMIWSLCLIVLSVLTQIYILPILFSIFMK